ncbi:penicillin-binding protein activator, partial [Pseudomonadota bacterium]|nr:penicillin-binding protein activator [Pseudomonadota bacterium]
DVILLAMDHENARQIIPQLRFHKAEKLPVFAGSRAFAFTRDVSFYKDLDGLYFLDVPMLNNKDYLFKATTESHYPRLFAFGYDALNLIPYLYQMERNEFLTYPGKTGYLRVNDEGIVIRNLNKYRIKNGKVKLAKMD